MTSHRLVVLGLAAVNGFHGEGVADDEGAVLLAAEVGQPVSSEHALGTDEEVFAEGGDGSEESVGSAGKVLIDDNGAAGIEDAEMESSCVQVDAGVESVRLVVKAHES